jgi:hypothetical protein
MLNTYVLYLLAALAAGGCLLAAVCYAGYRWGTFAALTALARHSPKWQAYFLALLPPLGFGLSLLFDSQLSGRAPETIMALVTPAFIAAGVRYNRGNLSEPVRNARGFSG